jgi:hypothetical protein
MSKQNIDVTQTLKIIEGLIDEYISRSSIDKAFALHYIIIHGFEVARTNIMLKFGSLKPYTEVLEDLNKVGINNIPDEAKTLMKVKSVMLKQPLVKDALDMIDRLDPSIKKVIAIALLLFEHGLITPGEEINILFDIYRALTGENLLDRIKEELSRYLYRLHIVELRYYSESEDRGEYSWSYYSPYIIIALKDKVPRVIIEFRDEHERPQ